MRRTPGLNVLSRREIFAVAGCVGLAVVGCTDGSLGGVQTGPLGSGGGNDAGGPDAPSDGHTSNPDASVPTDASSGATCTSGATDVGAPSSFVTGSPVYISSGNYFIVRDAGGLFAISAACTHEGATCVVQSGHYYCPRHGAEFKYDGTIIGGPVSRELTHYSMCTLANGHVGVVKTAVAKSQRLVA